AHPSTNGGSGLKAMGFSTTRDAYSANSTYGNYEDTHFGRACYIPPTMIPFSHKKETDLQTQRLNRLKTQATFYINGYQKDWYGFNKGALIGSFDGVNWFAIGSGRRVTATSKKLFLAINGAFLDIATRTDTVVNITPDSSGNVVSEVDYDPSLTVTDVRQNSAGSCQQFHQCSTDADCVTQLGWEYSCAEVGQMRSKWPIFDGEAKETVNQEKSGNIFEILAGTTSMGSSTKRCVYRGAGAPCVRDYSALNGKPNQKGLTCAPNFYCAGLDDSKFNDELVRSANDMDNILFGMEANVLGRPLKYVTASKTLGPEVKLNIQNSAPVGSLGVTASDMGICRPGRSVTGSDLTAHKTPDASKRTDYISQIGGCNSTTTGDARVSSCPAFGSDLNYFPPTALAATVTAAKNAQNSCGGESRVATGTFDSAFKTIESTTLQLLTMISQPTLVADACLRRPGAVCSTDLDCSPNKMHADISNSLSVSYFGGTEGEQNYWKESLICGQGAETPLYGSSNYSTYKLSENRCCREVGKDFTMYTKGTATLVPENMGSNVNLDTALFSSLDPKAANRYSRYAVSPTAIANRTAASTLNPIPHVIAGEIPAKNQWKVINETASSTCCGGGWIRKFADGTHDWKIKNRLQIEASNFACLNFRSPLASATYNNFSVDKIFQESYQREYESFCRSPGDNGCLQILWKDISNQYTIFPPTPYQPNDVENIGVSDVSPAPSAGTTRLDTMPTSDIDEEDSFGKLSPDVPYMPFPYYYTQFPYDLVEVQTDSGKVKRSLIYFSNKLTDYGVSIYLPAYIPVASGTFTPAISKIYIKYEKADGTKQLVDITSSRSSTATCNSVIGYSGAAFPIDALGVGTGEGWCVTSSSATSNRPVLNVKAYTGSDAVRPWARASVVIDFAPLEFQKGLVVTDPGSPAYYATKLSRLELIGIPQITYEPIYCNSDQSQLVPGIFTSTITTRTQFQSVAFPGYDSAAAYKGDTANVSESGAATTYGNGANYMTYQDKIGHSAVFSSKDFACCTPLGKETSSAAKCCSGSAATANGKTTCKIPSGTDLSVYFNKFVSNEGVGEDQPEGGLLITGTDEEIDFNAYTGEPKIRESTFTKLEELGKAYCQNGVVRNGGAFGQFGPEPYSGPYYTPVGQSSFTYPISIVDSFLDQDSNFGKFAFDSGFRWNHHYYCQ
ncbi:MAG: hypothetical protein K2Q18_06775, partial [Bdellovibrionales bacterium]|nr:hypothetical protein [Bdellovibrionales bacterium]